MLQKSWIASANDALSEFPLNNLPYGVFSIGEGDRRCGVAIGAMIFDCHGAEQAGLISLDGGPYFGAPSWNGLMSAGPEIWKALRARLIDLLKEGADQQDAAAGHLVEMADARLHMPFDVAEYTDFYAGRHHATNVGTMFRGAENALPPNWLHIPIGYNGRASSVVVSGTDITRPHGQLKPPTADMPHFAPSNRFDFELEMGAIIGQPSNGPVSVDEADAMIFGYVLLNDWSARDIQAWEYQPLGPFQAKATATTISPWIVTTLALEPFRVDTPERIVPLLDHIKDTGPMLYDIDLSVSLTTKEGVSAEITHTNYKEMYYSSAQQLAHHASSGCPMNVGDLIGSGTISGPERGNRGSLLELSWGGKEPLEIGSDIERSFIEDHDSISLRASAQGDGYQIGFGTCDGTLLPARKA